jgi:uncharacterized membrane protein YqjE
MNIETRQHLKNVVADLKIYVEKQVELKSIDVQEKLAVLVAAVLSNALGLIMALVGLMFLLVAGAIGIGYLLDNMMFGFLAMAVLLIIVGLIIYNVEHHALRRALETQFAAFVAQVLSRDMNKGNEHEDTPSGKSDSSDLTGTTSGEANSSGNKQSEKMRESVKP